MLQTIFDTKAARQYKGYLELKENVLYIKSLVSLYTNNYKFTDFFSDSTPEKIHKFEDIAIMNCIFLSIIILYAKLFTEAERRLIKLDRNIFEKSGEIIKKQHELIMDVRNKFVAHAGITQLESFDIMVTYKNGLTLFEKSSKTFAGQCVEKEQIFPILDIILTHIENKIVKSKEKVDREIKIIEKTRLHIFHMKAINNIPLNEDDIK